MTTLIIKATDGNYNVLGKLKFTLMRFFSDNVIFSKCNTSNFSQKY